MVYDMTLRLWFLVMLKNENFGSYFWVVSSGGVIALIQWFERTEAIFEICACPEASKVKYAAFTFTGRALTWWNGRVKSHTPAVANGMSGTDLEEEL